MLGGLNAISRNMFGMGPPSGIQCTLTLCPSYLSCLGHSPAGTRVWEECPRAAWGREQMERPTRQGTLSDVLQRVAGSGGVQGPFQAPPQGLWAPGTGLQSVGEAGFCSAGMRR